jgi:hypothetical protein
VVSDTQVGTSALGIPDATEHPAASLVDDEARDRHPNLVTLG